jgi:hypothetical protein
VPRTPKNLPEIQDKRAAVVQLRAQGHTWDQIATAVGYANGSGAFKAWKIAIKQHPDLAVDEIRAQEKSRLEQMDSVMAEIVTNPPIRATSIGRVMWDPRSCTCSVRGDSKRDHADDCQVQPVLDASAVIRASAERRALGESLRRLTNADLTQSAPIFDARTQIMVTQINEVRATKGQPPLSIPAPSGPTMPAAQATAAAAASLAALQPFGDRRRAEIQAEAFAAAGQPLPADVAAIIQGEIIP